MPMEILSNKEIDITIKRLAYEILERHYEDSRIFLAGINNSGFAFGELLQKEIKKLSDKDIHLIHLSINPAEPLKEEVDTDYPVEELRNECLIIIDDVANTGRTLFYASQPFLNTLPRRIETCVLVDRKHKSFPIKIDYYGISLATTLQENIKVNILGNKSVVLT